MSSFFILRAASLSSRFFLSIILFRPWGSNKNNVCWDQNGSETSEEADHGRDGGYNGGDEVRNNDTSLFIT